MKIDGEKYRMTVTKSDLSGSVFDDVNLSGSTYENANLSGLRIDKVNLAGAVIVNSRLQGMTIDGIDVMDLLAVWQDRQAGTGAAKA
jgi:uncharacterized protein YjbI with pentapeptide repeats